MPIILTVLGFLWWWPIGLLLLGLFLGRGKFGCRRHLAYAGDEPMFDRDHGRDRWERNMTRLQEKMEKVRDRMDRVRSGGGLRGALDELKPSPSTNTAEVVQAPPKRRSTSSEDFPAPECVFRDATEFDESSAVGERPSDGFRCRETTRASDVSQPSAAPEPQVFAPGRHFELPPCCASRRPD